MKLIKKVVTWVRWILDLFKLISKHFYVMVIQQPDTGNKSIGIIKRYLFIAEFVPFPRLLCRNSRKDLTYKPVMLGEVFVSRDVRFHIAGSL
jgi:hypothetical protein